MLKRAEPPICVGLYARWGSGKTFMISLLKKEFDPSVHEDPHTKRLLQFFEKDYKKDSSDISDTSDTVASLIRGLLLTIAMAFVPTMPYGVATFFSIICDAFDPREAFRGASAWCSRLRRSSWKSKAKTTPSGEGPSSLRGPYTEVSTTEDQPPQQPSSVAAPSAATAHPKARGTKKPTEMVPRETTKEFVFVDFNAWECAARVNPFSYALSPGRHRFIV